MSGVDSAKIKAVLGPTNTGKTYLAIERMLDSLRTGETLAQSLDLFVRACLSYFEENRPARAFIGSGPLLRNGNFEVQGVAVMR